MPADKHTNRRLTLYRAAHELVRSDTRAFRDEGRELAELFSESTLVEHRPDAAGLDGDARLLARLDLARTAAVEEQTSHASGNSAYDAAKFELDFSLDSHSAEVCVKAARRVVLAITIAADPNCTESIDAGICEFASLPWLTESDNWSERSSLMWTESGWNDHSRPSPRVLDILESAIGCVRQHAGPDEYNMTKPSEDPLEEARRALADIVRLAEAFAYRAALYAELIYAPTEDRDAVQGDVRRLWPEWGPALNRGRRALHGLRPIPLGIDFEPAVLAIDQLRSTLDEPLTLHPAEAPGEHLFRPAGPLGASKTKGSNLSQEGLAATVSPIARLSDRLRGIKEAGLVGLKPPEPDGEWWPASEFGPKLAARIRQAGVPQRKSKRVRSRVLDGVKLYSVDDARRRWASEIR
ncbi:MAG: hypothetical protein AB8F26_06975 [Phycisphaerales bacterium]